LIVDFYADPRFLFKQRQLIPVEVVARREYVSEIRALNVRGDQGGQ
jgi:hypothetical protein